MKNIVIKIKSQWMDWKNIVDTVKKRNSEVD